MAKDDFNLSQVSAMTEEEARSYIESALWPGGPVCPHCGGKKAWKVKAARSGVFKCEYCHKEFSVTVGTVMHGSHIALRQWVIAFHMMTSSKKGASALQLQRNLGLGSYKTAWHLAHRIRLSMNTKPIQALLRGDVEVDETYVGGKPRNGSGNNPETLPTKNRRYRKTKKTPVLALVERNGNVVSKPVEHVDAKTLREAIKEVCHKDCCIMTDESKCYHGIEKDFAGGHEVVNHSKKEYKRGNASTNTVESYFALLKRGVHGIFHHVSKRHLHRYCDEFSFRWNYRKTTDGERAFAAIQASKAKRLSYKPLVGQFAQI